VTAPPPSPWLSESSVWQLVESGGYRADLPAWEQLAGETPGPVLDLGCGTGRVAHHLAARGRTVLGIDRDPGICSDFNRQAEARGLDARAVTGDVLALERAETGPGRLPLILAPQQLAQILGGGLRRSRLLTGVASLLAEGGRAGFALVPDLPEASLELDLLPDIRDLDGWIYSSRPLSIESAEDRIELTRLRTRVSPAGELVEGTVVVRFDRLTPESFAPELEAAGLGFEATVPVPATAEHVGSVIVIARPHI